MTHGGKRKGAGRPKGAKDRATRRAGATIAELARTHGDEALAVLLSVAKESESDSARVAAANAILDRGYGKPPQAVQHTVDDRAEKPANLTRMSEVALAELEAALADEA